MNDDAVIKFRLYIAGDAPNSVRALFNLREICRDWLSGRHEVDVIDVFREPMRALSDGVFLTPTLVRIEPLPVRKVVGTLNQTETVLQVMGIERAPS